MYVQCLHCTNTSQFSTVSPKNFLHTDVLWHLLLKLFLQNSFSVCRAFKILKETKSLTCKWCLDTVVLYSDFPVARCYIIIGKTIIHTGNSLVPINISDDTITE